MKLNVSVFLSAGLGVLSAFGVMSVMGQSPPNFEALETRELRILDDNGEVAVRLGTLDGGGYVMVFQAESGQPAAGLLTIPKDSAQGVFVYDENGNAATASQYTKGVAGLTIHSETGEQGVSMMVDRNNGLRSFYLLGDSGYPTVVASVDAAGVPELGVVDPGTKAALWKVP